MSIRKSRSLHTDLLTDQSCMHPHTRPGPAPPPSIQIHDMDMFVAPIGSYMGSEIATDLFGHETFWTRCFHKTMCGKNCCPMQRSTLDVTVRVADVQTVVSHLDMFESLRRKEEVSSFRQASAELQKSIIEAAQEDPGLQQQPGTRNKSNYGYGKTLRISNHPTQNPITEAEVVSHEPRTLEFA